MKSANCISATGRIPLTERPMAEPTIRLSARGVSMTRRDPNSSWSPWVTLNTPPALPTSSPITITVSSARISSASPSWIACNRFFSAISLTLGVDALERLFGIGEGRLFRVLARLGDLRLYLGRYLLSPLLVEEPVLHQILLEAHDRVLLAPLLDGAGIGIGWSWSGGVLGTAAGLMAVIAWFALVFAATHPRGLWD